MKHVSNDIYNTLLTLGRRIENAPPQKKEGEGLINVFWQEEQNMS